MKYSFVARCTLLAATSLSCNPADACSRVVYAGPDHTVVTGRSMDWMVPLNTNLWMFPVGTHRAGAAGPNSLHWISKYGSVVSAAYDSASPDGMNQKGLVANLLYLSTAQYEARNNSKPALSLAGWPQYVLDNYATVAEAVADLKREEFQVVAPPMPGGYAPTMHLSISDATGDSAIFEYIGGTLVIHHDARYAVMTNEPSFDKQLALDEYWREIGGNIMLPGTDRPADRFVRASYYLHQSLRTSDTRASVAGMFSIMRNVSVPMGVDHPGSPNIAPTLWRTVADQKNLVYYFEDTSRPNVFWVDFSKLNFAAGEPPLELNLQSGTTFSGEVSASFGSAPSFNFMDAGGTGYK